MQSYKDKIRFKGVVSWAKNQARDLGYTKDLMALLFKGTVNRRKAKSA